MLKKISWGCVSVCRGRGGGGGGGGGGGARLDRVNPRSLEEGVKLTPLDFFGFKYLLLDRLSKAWAQLFLVCEHIF